MIVDDPQIARFVSVRGVDTLFVDLEQHGKLERQGHVASWKSSHTMEDVTAVREAAPDCDLLVRINPIHDSSKLEINEVISRGANKIMLPMFREFDEVAQFLDLIADRATAVPLFETSASLLLADRIARETSVRLAHFGMNDLHLELGSTFMFEPLCDGILEQPCSALRSKGVSFGIGGLARAREGIVSPDYLLGEHVRLGSNGAILSRTFHRGAQTLDELKRAVDFEAEVERLREIFRQFTQADRPALEANRLQTCDRIRDVANLIAREKGMASEGRR
ncbi:aldolase/citrate lyase family protein [Altererythrobacter sp. MF3-039]|uniref:aldolase/citrate lyase family protein n=1 Tax=Altererythrobacter sp. MF3-039 TaxID=3252901 RepID=UPI00390CC407